MNGYINSHCLKSLDETCFGRRNICQNNGTCVLKSAHLYVDHPQSECQCADGYSGQWCEDDQCLELNCQNNGTCERLADGRAKCLCNEYWSGSQCEDDVNECEEEKGICLNNGTCLNYPGDYQCQCSENYLGKHCEEKHICLERSPCLNEGKCFVDEENYYCECSTNFTGMICELLTCESVPCEHNGTCLPDADQGFRCNCSGTGRID